MAAKVLSPGDRAPEIRLPDLDGQTRALKELDGGKPSLVVLFKISCPTCQFTLPYLERMKGGGVSVVGISQDDAESTREFNQEFGVTFPTLVDEPQYRVSEGFRITHVPSMFLVEGDGRISWSSVGWSRQAIEELGKKAGVEVVRPGEFVPEWKSG
ncbi:MAG: TlpA disulfide reductase family protein [Bryobacteraceae bacterium]|nr:TlpA disulfide reductase family protein [Bryobacteraceae bacterium]